jgi:biotin carboxyl carrier protein
MTNTSRTFTVTLGDVDYQVVAEGGKITVNGRPFNVDVREDGTVLVDGIAYDVALEGDTAQVGDDTYDIEVAGLSLTSGARAPLGPPGPSAQAEPGDGAIVAIMPGKVTRVLVEEGQEVEDGEAVCVLEAMKMENELRADRDGVVAAVHVSPGDDVEKDQVLVELR